MPNSRAPNCPTGDHPKGSLFGIQGGLFESWFTVKAQG